MATTELRWRSSFSGSCLHAAACLSRGLSAADAAFGQAIAQPAAALDRELGDVGWSPEQFYPTLVALSGDFENNRELVLRTATQLQMPVSPDSNVVTRVAGAIADLEAAVRRALPNLAEELAVRGRPLREQWDARGPGMFVEVSRLTDPLVLPEFAEVVLVTPFVGGHGWAHVARNRVTFEAMLVNPVTELPEAVRLAWLVAQLAADQPPLADVLDRPTSERVVPVALLPPVLAAANAVELVGPLDQALVEKALATWRVDLGEASPADVAASVWQWWQTWLAGPARWHVAVAALGQLLPKI